MSEASLRPPLVFRVGVTGHRDVAEDDKRIVAAVEAVLTFVRDALAGLAASAPAQSAYAAAPKPFTLRVVSPLAVGADRIVARAGLKLGAELYAPLPFKQADYVSDFEAEAAAFEALVKQARVFELDGAHVGGDAQTQSYTAVGRFVARNCDLLIAIWDSDRRSATGGTGDIVSYAARNGLRVWWIDAKRDAPPRLLRHNVDFHAREDAPAGEAAFKHLADQLAAEILPAEAEPPEREGPLGFLAAHYRRWGAPDQSPLQEFFAETPRPRGPLWSAHARFMDLAAPAEPAPTPAPDPGVGPWATLYNAANQLSIDYGERYRSSYVWVALMVVVALATVPMGAAPDIGWQEGWVILEVAALLAISLLVLHNYAWRWHERWITYRLVAELARKQRVLALIGQSLPSADVVLLTAAARRQRGEQRWRDIWIAWLFAAYRRAGEPPTGRMDDSKRAAFEAARRLIEEQLAYHEARRDRCERAGARVRNFAELFFLFTIAAAFAKLFLAPHGGPAVADIVLMTSLLSALATALVGIRAYAEFDLLVRQSTHMLHALEAARLELAGLKLDAPLASTHLGHTLVMTTTAMMQDITGWAHLFRAKTLETG